MVGGDVTDVPLCRLQPLEGDGVMGSIRKRGPSAHVSRLKGVGVLRPRSGPAYGRPCGLGCVTASDSCSRPFKGRADVVGKDLPGTFCHWLASSARLSSHLLPGAVRGERHPMAGA